MPDPVESLRLKLVSQVRGVFHDASKGHTPTPPSDEALFARDTPIRQVHADIVGMMTGGVRALLLQMLHPHALQGVLDHSNFREDMHGRLRRGAVPALGPSQTYPAQSQRGGREFVAMHGGDVTVRSEVGRGSTFIVRLPRARTLAAVA